MKMGDVEYTQPASVNKALRTTCYFVTRTDDVLPSVEPKKTAETPCPYGFFVLLVATHRTACSQSSVSNGFALEQPSVPIRN